MKASFWDVKARENVNVDVTEAIQYANGRYAYKGKTADGRNLTRFVSKVDYEKYQASK
ncbi:MAG: hypothetical protein WCS73_01115 [Lentisphaeria bacterium]